MAENYLRDFYSAKGASPLATRVFEDNMRKDLCTFLGVEMKGIAGGSEGFTGGSCIGGYDALQDYGNSMFSKAKEKLIRDIADDVFSALKSSGVKNARTAPIGDVVASLAKLLPPRAHSARKFGKDFNKSSESQRKVCHALANSLNRHYGGSIVDMSASESDMCNKVAEVMYSLFTGLHTEFMTVAGDVMRVMNNLQSVMTYIDAAYKKQKELIEASADTTLRDQSANTDSVYQQIKAEYERQMAILANLINVTVGPTGKSLVSSLEENRDFAGLVKDIKAQVGTSAFGDKLAFLLAGVSSVAHSAELIDKALKKIGMSVQEFKSAKNSGDLRVKVMNSMMKGRPSSKQLDDMMRAAQIIYDNNYDHDAVSKALSKKGGKGGENGNASDSDDEPVQGGDEELPAYWAKKSLTKKLENKKKYRTLVLNDFRKLLRSHYQGIMDAANNIAHNIGTVIPLSDDLDHFVRVFKDLPSMDKENLHIALSGYPKDSTSREARDKFFNNYEIVINTLEPLSKGPKGEVFKSLQSALKSMLKAIDDFSDKMVNALTEIHVDSPDEIAAALRKTSSSFYGSGDGGEDSFGSGSWVAFDKVKMELNYFYSIANIKTNIARSADDLKSYSSDYEQILGEEAGWLINRIRAEYKVLLEINDYTPAAGAYQEPSSELKELAGDETVNRARATWTALHVQHIAAADKSTVAAAFKNLKNLWERQMNAKVNMVKVAQAVDLYLKSFTDGISRNPDSVQSVVKMLDQVELVARWFNDKSGDNLAGLFEVFPCGVDITAAGGNVVREGDFMDSKTAVVDDNSVKVLVEEKKHYYQVIEEKCVAGGAAVIHLPGNPFIGRPLSGDITTEKQLGNIFTLSERVVKSMRALENILSAFSSVGSKFGDLDPAAHTFMNPGQIFKAMCDYLVASAFTSQFAPNLADRTAAIYRGKVTQAQTVLAGGGGAVAIPSSARPAQFRPAVVSDADVSNSIAAANNHVLNKSPGAFFPQTVPVGERGILTGVSDGMAVAAAVSRKTTSLAMSAIPSDSADDLLRGNYWNYHSISSRGDRVDAAGWRDDCYDTDFLFLMTVKSIVAKVFTVVDAYRLFHRPTTGFGSHHSLNPLRTILGGAEGGAASKVPVIPEAIELYLRLPLLAEWYREKFNFSKLDQGADPEAWKLSLVPSIDGVWSGFVSIMFDKADFVTQGNYTETQVQALINEMNHIWKLYRAKYPKATVRQIINAYVLEMNRIFGFVKAKEIKKYLDERRDYLKTPADVNGDNFYDYDILNANDQFGSRPAPSDKFVSVGMKPNPRSKRNEVHLLKAINDLRREMDRDFINATSTDGAPTFTFIDTLRNYKNEMANAKNDTEEYQVVLRMIQGASKSVRLGTEKLIMIHEMIAAPLATLYATYKVVARYNALLHGASLVNLSKYNAIRIDAAAAPAGLAGLADIRGALADNLAVLRSYKVFLNQVAYTERSEQAGNNRNDNVHLALFARMLSGNDPEDAFAAANGYVLAAPAANPLRIGTLDFIHICQDLLAAIIDVSSNPNKLVTCSVGAGGNINIDFGALEDLCKSTLMQIKENAKKLRQMFPPSHTNLVDKYENLSTVGSTRWLEENLIKVLFEDRDKCGLPRAHTEHLIPTLKQLFNPPTAAAGAAAVGANITAATVFGSMDRALQGLVYYEMMNGENSLPRVAKRNNFTKFPFNVIPMRKAPETADEKLTVSLSAGTDDYPAALAPGTAHNINLNNLTYAPYVYFENLSDGANDVTLDTWHLANDVDLLGSNQYKSLLTAFNTILRMYLHTNFEDGSAKFYAPLIESFAYGAASLEIVQNKAFPDVGVAENGVAFAAALVDVDHDAHMIRNGDGSLGAPPAETVVFASNALAIRGILTTSVSIGTSQKKKFVFENFAEIPEHLKERMKVNLPFFSKILQNLADRALLLKSIINNTTLAKNIEHPVPADCDNAANGASATRRVMEVSSALNVATMDTDANHAYYNGLLTKFSNLSLELKKCADNVYKELQDKVPYFLETSKDFLVDYRQRVGGMPIMPASSILVPLRCLEGDYKKWDFSNESHVMLPVKENGSAAYRFNYATRLLLARNDVEFQLDHMPGAKELYNSYATVTSKNVVMSPQEYADTLKNMVKLVKFLSDGAVYGRLYDRSARNLNAQDTRYSTRNVFGAVGWEQETAVITRVLPAIAAAVQAAGGRAVNITLPLMLNGSLPAADLAAVDAQVNGNNPVAALPALLAAADDGFIPVGADRLAARSGARFAALLPVLRDRYGSHTANAAEIARNTNLTARLNSNLSCLPLQTDPGQFALSGLLELTENANARSSKERLGQAMGAEVSDNSNSDRKSLAVQNILEYNIVPINVHAFMREVPFVNLLNYSYTFDRMVHDFVLPSYVSSRRGNITTENLMIAASDSNISSTRELMVKLLVHPYANLGNEGLQYFALAASLFNGNDDLKLGRPRYLSDQLWHKVLLTSSAQLVAGQDIYNSSGVNYFANLRSAEGGPASLEAARSVVRFGAPGLNQLQTSSDVGHFSRSVATARLTLFNVIHAGIAAIAGSGTAINLYLDNLRAPRPALIVAAYNVYDAAAAVRQYVDIHTPLNAALAPVPVGDLRDVLVELIAEANVHHAAAAPEAPRHYRQQAIQTAVLVGAHGIELLWRTSRDAAGRTVADLIVAGNAHDALINTAGAAGFLAANYDTAFQNMLQGAAGGRPVLPRYQAAVNIFRNPATAFIDSAADPALAAANDALDNLIADLEEARSGAETFRMLPPPFNVAPTVTTNNRLNGGMYHLISFFVDSFPNHTNATRHVVKMIVGLALHQNTNATVLSALDNVIASNEYNNMDFFEQCFIRGLRTRVAGRGAAALATANDEAAETALTAFVQHSVSAMREVADLVEIIRRSMGTAGTMTPLRATALAPFILPSDPVATRGLKVMRPSSNGQWQEAKMGDVGTARQNQMRPADVLYCAELGKMRFDTKLVRNLTWLVQLQRVMRVVLINHLSWLNTPVVRGLKIADPKITEFNANEGFDESDFTGANYSAL